VLTIVNAFDKVLEVDSENDNEKSNIKNKTKKLKKGIDFGYLI